MKDLTLKNLKPITKGDQLLKELLDDKIYDEVMEERMVDAKEEYAQDY